MLTSTLLAASAGCTHDVTGTESDVAPCSSCILDSFPFTGMTGIELIDAVRSSEPVLLTAPLPTIEIVWVEQLLTIGRQCKSQGSTLKFDQYDAESLGPRLHIPGGPLAIYEAMDKSVTLKDIFEDEEITYPAPSLLFEGHKDMTMQEFNSITGMRLYRDLEISRIFQSAVFIDDFIATEDDIISFLKSDTHNFYFYSPSIMMGRNPENRDLVIVATDSSDQLSAIIPAYIIGKHADIDLQNRSEPQLPY